jgi:hypothetical protein
MAGMPGCDDTRYDSKIPKIRLVIMSHFTLNEKITLKPGESISGPEGLRIKHSGYGHRILIEGGDRSFFEFEITQGTDSTTMRIYVPINKQQTTEWGNWKFDFMKCDENGPPHSPSEPVELVVSHK